MMLTLIRTVLFTALMFTAACATAPPPLHELGTTPAVSTRDTLADERALYAAEAAYNLAGTAYLASRDVLPGPVKDQARSGLVLAYDALLAARAAYRAGDAGTFGAQLAAATEAVARVRSLLPGDT